MKLASIAMLSVATVGFYCAHPGFWTIPNMLLGSAGAAASIGLINSFGNLGGFFAPNLKAWAELVFGPNAGLYAVAAAPFLAMILFFSFKSADRSESIEELAYRRPTRAAS